MKKLIQLASLALALSLPLHPFAAEDNAAESLGEHVPEEMLNRYDPASTMPNRGAVDSVRLVRAEGWDWDHEVRVYLPASYHHTEKRYPTLWVTDNTLELMQGALFGDSLGLAPELIWRWAHLRASMPLSSSVAVPTTLPRMFP